MHLPLLLSTAALLLAGAQAVRQVAVIGAGAAGASTAFHLRQFADEAGVAVNITVFEKTGRIGGRTLTVDAYGDARQPVELGASVFVKVNEILWTAADNFSLPRAPAGAGGGDSSDGGDGADDVLGIWDGARFVYTQDEGVSSWWNLVRLVWTYGTAPYRANKLMQATIDRFLALYRAPYFPFRSLTTRAYELELAYVTGQTGVQFLRQHKVGARFAHDIVQASTRVNYASDLARIHGLDTMVALAPLGASQIRGGNWQIFDRMVRASGARFAGNTSVTGIALAKPASASASASASAPGRKAFTVATAEQPDGEVFDNVVLATPLQFSDIVAGDGVLQTAVDAIPYVRLHVTLFASPLQLSAAFFGLPAGAKVPTTVLTTLPGEGEGEGEGEGDDAAPGKPAFFSISTLRRATNPQTQRREYLYKIFSPDAVTPAFLSALFGVDVPASFTGDASAADAAPAISWYYPHVFHSYPQALPRVTFQDPVVGDGVYYTSGIESFISTMETSALMGKNVARLIVDDMLGLATGGAVHAQAAPEAGEL